MVVGDNGNNHNLSIDWLPRKDNSLYQTLISSAERLTGAVAVGGSNAEVDAARAQFEERVRDYNALAKKHNKPTVPNDPINRFRFARDIVERLDLDYEVLPSGASDHVDDVI